MDKKENKKGMGVVIALAVVILIGLVIATVAIVNMIKENGGFSKEDTSLYSRSEITTTEKTTLINWDETVSETEDVQVQQQSNNGGSGVEAGDVVTVPQTTKKAEVYNPIEEYEKLSKKGDNILSDHHNNKYIKLVSDKYAVDKDLLVAIYSEPDDGNNFVLEFSGEIDEDGNIIKSPDTLAKVYSIDKNKNIAIATGKVSGNVGVSYAEGTLCFNMVKTIVMAQYPEYFSGVEK